jgi:hypothetical protein
MLQLRPSRECCDRDLPPARFELILDRKTAKALGLTIAPSVVLRVDQIIE